MRSAIANRLPALMLAAGAAVLVSACTYVERDREPSRTIVVPQAQPSATVVTPAPAPPTVTVRPSY